MSVASIKSGRPSALAEFWYYFSRNKGAVIGLAIFVFVLLLAVFAAVVAPHDPLLPYGSAMQRLPPAWAEGGNPSFPLGTDANGRDMLSRLIYGTRFSLFIGLVVASLSALAGVLIGLVAGYVGGRTDTIIMRIMDIILAVPSLLLALVLVAILGPGLTNAMIAISIVNQPHFVRLTRASVLAEREKEYVIASRVAGAGRLRLMFKTILPNCFGPLIVQATLAFSAAILDAAALGFLGMGAQPPTPEWGTMLADAREFYQSNPSLVTFPGLCILITVLAINLMGDGLRDALDPKLKRS
jgi:dipeptide transport system permease protein